MTTQPRAKRRRCRRGIGPREKSLLFMLLVAQTQTLPDALQTVNLRITRG